jgi:hypothetical protein
MGLPGAAVVECCGGFSGVLESQILAPICLNPAAVRSVLPVVTFWTKMALAGKSMAEMATEAKAALDTKKLPVVEPGAMSFMMSKDGYLADDNPHFHPHVMFFEPLGEGL